MEFKAAIFDMDGTLVKTKKEYRYKVVGDTLKDLKVSSYSKEYIDKFWFCGERDKIIRERFGLEPMTFWKKFREHDNRNISLRKKHTEVYDDVDFIPELRQNGYKTGIVTSAPIPIAYIEIEILDKENFDAIVIQNYMTNMEPKPHPHGLKKCLNLLDVMNSEALYVGNSDEDILTARNTRVLDVLIDRGEHEFQEITPSVKVHSLYGLRQLLGL